MSQWKKLLGNFFQFSKKERTGLWVLMILLILAWVIPEIFSKARHEKEWKEFETQLGIPGKERELQEENNVQGDSTGNRRERVLRQNSPAYKNVQFFYFDPNTLSDSGWYRLGISVRNLQTIRNYLSKGGRFYQPDDLNRIYGLHKDWTKMAIPFVRIEEKDRRRSSGTGEKSVLKYVQAERPKLAISTLEINRADSVDWEKLPGIGPKLAQRIIRFRSRLGGFYSVQQIAEVYGLKDSVFKRIKSLLFIDQDFKPDQVDLNEATIRELASHPYINYSMARNIVRFREEHGPYRRPEEISLVGGISDQDLLRILPYVKIH